MKLVHTRSFELAVYARGDKKSEKLALVLPGRLDTKDYPHMIGHVDYLAPRRFYAVSFDPPGTWESPGGIKLYSMTNYLKAINELIEFFGNKPTLLVGHSRGGSMAMLAGTTSPEAIAFISIMSGYSYKPEVYGYPNKEWKDVGYKVNTRDVPNSTDLIEFKLPFSFAEDQAQYDMQIGLSNSKIPKMFVYGKRDITVEPNIVKTAYEISSDPKELKELDSDHDYRFKPNLIKKVNEFIGEFLEKNF